MYGIYANIGGIVMVHVTIYGIHGSYTKLKSLARLKSSAEAAFRQVPPLPRLGEESQLGLAVQPEATWFNR